MITIVDYGLGNIRAFLNVYRRLNIDAQTATTADELRGASKVILPGVGAFDHAMDRLTQSGMRDMLDDLALRQRVPILGVCVGMQILGRASDEGRLPGLGWIDGRVKALDTLTPGETLLCRTRVVDVYEKPGRSGPLGFVVREITATDRNGDVAATMRQATVVRL